MFRWAKSTGIDTFGTCQRRIIDDLSAQATLVRTGWATSIGTMCYAGDISVMIIQMGIRIDPQIFSIGGQKKMVRGDRCCHDVAGRRREPLRRGRFFVVIHEKFYLQRLDFNEIQFALLYHQNHTEAKIHCLSHWTRTEADRCQRQNASNNNAQISQRKRPQSDCQLALCLAGKWVKSWVIVAFLSLIFEAVETYACRSSSLARRPSCSPTRTKVSMELSELCRRSSSQVTIPALKTTTQVLPP